jgi:hypothetical protein
MIQVASVSEHIAAINLLKMPLNYVLKAWNYTVTWVIILHYLVIGSILREKFIILS